MMSTQESSTFRVTFLVECLFKVPTLAAKLLPGIISGRYFLKSVRKTLSVNMLNTPTYSIIFSTELPSTTTSYAVLKQKLIYVQH